MIFYINCRRFKKILLQPLNEFYEYLKDVEAKVEGLKKVRPNCESLKQSYEDVYGEYRKILDIVNTHLDKSHGILEGYKRTLETKKEDINGYINTLNRQATICSLWFEIEKEVSKLPTLDEISKFKIKHDETMKKLEDCKNQIAGRVYEIDDLIKTIDYYQTELRELGRDTHDWEEIREKVAYPAAKPDETRVVEKATRKRCKKCSLERSV